MVSQEVRHKCAKPSYQAAQQAVESAFPNNFITGTAETEDGMENISYQYIKTKLTTLAEKRTLDAVFDRSIEGWTLIEFVNGRIHPPCTKRAVLYATYNKLCEVICRKKTERVAHTGESKRLFATGS